MKSFVTVLVTFGLLLVTTLACTREHTWEPILLSKESCHYCRMVISDKRFGAEFVTNQGKVYKFDSVECMMHFYKDNRDLKGRTYIVDSFSENQLVDFKQASIVLDPNVRSPMGKGFFASGSREIIEKNNSNKYKIMDWTDVLKEIGRSEFISNL